MSIKRKVDLSLELAISPSPSAAIPRPALFNRIVSRQSVDQGACG